MIVADSLVILEYLEGRWPQPSLFPAAAGRDAVKVSYERMNALFAPHLPKVARGTPEERAVALGEALASFVAKLPEGWRPTSLGLEGMTRWERAVMDRPAVQDQMAARTPG